MLLLYLIFITRMIEFAFIFIILFTVRQRQYINKIH